MFSTGLSDGALTLQAAMARFEGAPPGSSVVPPSFPPVPIMPGTIGAWAAMGSAPLGLDELLTELGADLTTPAAVFCGLLTADLEAALGEVTVSGEPLTPIQKAGLVVFIRALFVSCGHAAPALGGCAPSPVGTVLVPAVAPAAAAAASGPVQESIQMQAVLDQTLKLTAPALTYGDLADLRNAYEKVVGRPPVDEQLPTLDQMSALKALLATGRVPYVDFAVWTPYGGRLAKFRKTEATVIVGSEFVTKSVEGPRSFEAWEQSWALFEVAMISLGAASPGTLAAYANGLRVLMRLFPGRWSVLVSTDVVVRTERWSRLRETFERTRDVSFDPGRPWDAVIAASAYGSDGPLAGSMASWWSTHFVLPATMVTSSSGMEAVIGKVESQPAVPSSGASSARAPPAKRARTRKPNPAQTDSTPCNNWNFKKGACAGGGPCPHGRRHVCGICKGPHRELDHEDDAEKSSTYWPKRRDRKGKGAGKA